MRLIRLAFIYCIFVAALILTAISLQSVRAATTSIIYVDADSTATVPDGSSWTNAFPHLQDALAAAGTPSNGDIAEIWVAEGVYYPDEGSGIAADVVTNTFDIPARVQLFGGFDGTESTKADRDWENHLTILSGDITQDDNVDDYGVTRTVDDIATPNSNRVVDITTGTSETILDGFVVTAGNAGSGTGIGISDSTAQFKNLTIVGNSGLSAGSVLLNFSTMNATPVTFSNVRILNNASSTFGGGIYNNGGNVQLNDLIIEGNTTLTQGGGVHNRNGSMTFNNVRLSNNTSFNTAGGFYADGTSTQSFTNFIIENNESTNTGQNGGGGMYINGGETTLQDGIFRGNLSGWHGGGLYAQSGTINMINVVFSGNFSGNTGGGALLNHTSIAMVTNVTVAGNHGDGGGGGLKVNSTDATLTNVVSWGNRDNSGSNTLSANFLAAHTAMVMIAHSNIQGSGGSNAWGVPMAMDGGGNIDGNPQFVAAELPVVAPTAAGSYRILSSSNLIDGGNDGVDLDGNGPLTATVASLATDLDGSARISGIAVDIGAYEYDTTISVSVPTTTTLVEGGDGVTVTLRLFNSPASQVIVPLSTSNNQCAVSLEMVTLSAANWSSGVAVNVSATDDIWVDGNQDCWLETGRSESTTKSLDNYDPEDYLFRTKDNDIAGVVMTPATGEVAEGSTTSLAVRLNTAPSQPVTLNFSANASVCQLGSNSLTINGTNWKKAATLAVQVVANPQVTGNQICQVTATTSSSDTSFNGLAVTPAEITVTEQNTAGISFPSGSIVITESQQITQLIQTLTDPLEPVTITLNVSSTSASPIDCQIEPSQAQISTAGTAFTFIAAEDDRADGNSRCTIAAVVESDDPAYDGLNVGSFTLDVVDTNTAGYELIGGTQTIPKGKSADVSFRLTTIPLEPVTATLSSGVGCGVDRSSIVFSNTGPAGDLEKVVVTPQNDSCTVAVTISSSDSKYDGMVVPPISITVSDSLPPFSIYLPLITK